MLVWYDVGGGEGGGVFTFHLTWEINRIYKQRFNQHYLIPPPSPLPLTVPSENHYSNMLGGDFINYWKWKIHSVLMVIFTFHLSVSEQSENIMSSKIKKYSQNWRLAKVYQFFLIWIGKVLPNILYKQGGEHKDYYRNKLKNMSTWKFSIWKTSIYLGDNNPNTNKLLSLKMVKIFTRIEV